MKVVIGILISCLLAMGIGGLTTQLSESPAQAQGTVQPKASEPEKQLEVLEPLPAEDIPESEMNKSLMVDEVVELWEMFLDDGGASPEEYRRHQLDEYAGYLVNMVQNYQEHPTDIGGMLPEHENVHLLIATRVTKESSLYPEIVGKKGEVGLLQVMPGGPAAAGYTSEQIQRNPRLGLLLGIRWLAYSTSQCKFQDPFDIGWTDYDWLGPVSYYAGGHKAKMKNGRCAHYKIAKKLVERTLLYKARLTHDRE